MAKLLSTPLAHPGWYSVYKDNGGEYELPVALWAVMEDEDDLNLRWPASYSVSDGDASGLNISPDDEDGNFACYCYKDPAVAPAL